MFRKYYINTLTVTTCQLTKPIERMWTSLERPLILLLWQRNVLRRLNSHLKHCVSYVVQKLISHREEKRLSPVSMAVWVLTKLLMETPTPTGTINPVAAHWIIKVHGGDWTFWRLIKSTLLQSLSVEMGITSGSMVLRFALEILWRITAISIQSNNIYFRMRMRK